MKRWVVLHEHTKTLHYSPTFCFQGIAREAEGSINLKHVQHIELTKVNCYPPWLVDKSNINFQSNSNGGGGGSSSRGSSSSSDGNRGSIRNSNSTTTGAGSVSSPLQHLEVGVSTTTDTAKEVGATAKIDRGSQKEEEEGQGGGACVFKITTADRLWVFRCVHFFKVLAGAYSQSYTKAKAFNLTHSCYCSDVHN